MSQPPAPTTKVSRFGAGQVVDVEITAATPELARAAFAAFASSSAVLTADELRRPIATSDGYVLLGRAALVR